MASTTASTLIDIAARARVVHKSLYGYTPTFWVCILFLSLFGTTTVLHLGQALFIKPRLYWLLPTLGLCGVCETLGWAARLWSNHVPTKLTPFLIQNASTVIGPTFLTAALYTILSNVITQLGSHYSRLTPKAYIITFLTADIIALAVQAFGAFKASTAFSDNRSPDPGAHIMLGGIFLQMAGISLYLLVSIEFLLRFHLDKPIRAARPSLTPFKYTDGTPAEKFAAPSTPKGRATMSRRLKLMVLALVLTTILVLIRSVYRTVELLGGFRGRIITTEIYFNVFDGVPIVLAMAVLNALPPAVLLRRARGGYALVVEEW